MRKKIATGIAALFAVFAVCFAWTRIDVAIRTSYGLGMSGAPLEASGNYRETLAFPMLRFSQPLFATTAPGEDQRLYVVEKTGRVRVLENKEHCNKAPTFLQVPVRDSGEQGLLGLAFSPDYQTSGHLFVYYTPKTGARRSRISRFLVDPENRDRALPSSELVLLEVPQPYSNHNGGMLCFGPDGNLYIGLGDGGSAGDPKGHGQNPGTLLGSILRIRPTAKGYEIPRDNPFVGQPGKCAEIYAWGLRNPWRFSFDRDTGTLWVGDVGQNRREEVHWVDRGDNLGWDLREGELPYERASGRKSGVLRSPIHTYAPSIGSSITGGYVYRGHRLPGLRGAYVFGDYSSGRVWALRHEGEQVQTVEELVRIPSVASFAEDASGELLILSLSGDLYRLEEAPKAAESTTQK